MVQLTGFQRQFDLSLSAPAAVAAAEAGTGDRGAVSGPAAALPIGHALLEVRMRARACVRYLGVDAAGLT